MRLLNIDIKLPTIILLLIGILLFALDALLVFLNYNLNISGIRAYKLSISLIIVGVIYTIISQSKRSIETIDQTTSPFAKESINAKLPPHPVELHPTNPTVFLSFSSKDRKVAHEVKDRLEEAGVSPFFAETSIDVGESYATQILRGIDNSKYFILLITSNSVKSRHVISELERAFSKDCILMPIFIENIEIPKEWEYFLSSSQWKKAFEDNQWIDNLIAKLKS